MTFLFYSFCMKIVLLLFCIFLSINVCSQSYQDLNLQQLTSAANDGDEVAMSFLAEIYEKGINVDADVRMASKWYKKAAELNYPPAQYNYSILLGKGKHSQVDLPQAFFWAEKSAKQHYAPAQFLLAIYYAQGSGVEANNLLAQQWYHKAASQDHVAAQYNLGIMLLKDSASKESIAQGRMWIKKAADQNYAAAIKVQKLLDTNN